MLGNIVKDDSSFRDPSGFVFKKDNELFRQINYSYKENYDYLMESGLYQKLVDKNLLIPHSEVKIEEADTNYYKIIKPKFVNFISYPYEWSFTMLKDAALLTLKIQKLAIKNGMSLKDASAYNVQFIDGKPIFIDTLSFEKFTEKPWVGYAQFCRHFLAPLLLAAYVDYRLIMLLKDNIDGIPLDLTAKLLPIKTKFNMGILANIHLHAQTCSKYENKSDLQIKSLKMTSSQQLALIETLQTLIKSLQWQPKNTEWGDYYTFTNYTDSAFENKKIIIENFLSIVKPKTCWDMGANNGYFTRIASTKGITSIAFDIDPIAVEKNYLMVKNSNESNILPLIYDLTNPSPSIGWNCSERLSVSQRGKAELVMALALIHHLAISNNLPLSKIAEFFSNICDNLIIEFVPKSDSKVKILLSTREDIFPNYDIEHFETEFLKHFKIIDKQQVQGSDRILYLFGKSM